MTRIMANRSIGHADDKSEQLRARMKLCVHAPQVPRVHVRVDLGRRDVCVTEHLLYRAKVRASLQKVGCERVTERVGRDALLEARLIDVMPQDVPGPHPRQRSAPGVE